MSNLFDPKDFKFQLGDTVRCRITGFEGVAISYAKYLANCDKVEIQPAMKKDSDKIPEAYTIDVTVLERLDVPRKLETPYTKPEFWFGDQVEEPIIGKSGTITALAWHMNGCRLMHVISKFDPKAITKEVNEGQWWNEGRLQLIEKHPEPKKMRKATSTGGPLTPEDRARKNY